MLIQELTRKQKRVLEFLLENKDHEDDPVLESQIRELRAQIVAAERERDLVAKAELERMNLPEARSSWAEARAFARRLETASGDERVRLRRSIIQRIRNVLAEVRFSSHSIAVVAELPGKPTEGPFGPIRWMRAIETRTERDVEGHFVCDKIYTEDPEQRGLVKTPGLITGP